MLEKAANPSSGRDRRADRMKSNANPESRPRASAVRLQATAWPPSICCRLGLLRYQRPFIGGVRFWPIVLQKSFCGMTSNGPMQTAGGLSFNPDDRAPSDPMSTRSDVHGCGLNLPSWVVVGNDIARVATISVETTPARGVIAISLAVTPS